MSVDSVGAAAAEREAGGRRRAFETNLKSELAEALGDRMHPAARAELVRALGEAHEAVRHAFDARASFGLSGRRLYTVMQFGARALLKGPDEVSAGPLSARVFARIPDAALEGLTTRERQTVAVAVERSEIRSVHPVDLRPRLRLGLAELYANILIGRDRRAGDPAVKDDRRVPPEETLGLAAVLAIAVVFAGIGLWMIGGVLAGAAALFADPRISALWNALGG
ncbi:MAG: hypothetical protein ACE37J_09545 [Pikeienuella sp.]|uniref:hypothetical protein n=1 Tax=Pikeienuella sp. TaxID=2831957 RepID=UPI00391C90EC